MSGDSPAFSLPLISNLGALVQWLLFINILLVGVIILLAARLSAVERRLRDAQDPAGGVSGDEEDDPEVDDLDFPSAPPHRRIPLSDDRPIPLVRDKG